MSNEQPSNETEKSLTNPTEEVPQKKSFWSKITLEPIWIGCMVPASIIGPINKNLALERACLVDLGYSREDCFSTNATIKKLTEMESQKVVASLTGGSNFVTSAIVCTILLFLGPWSDRCGRRKPLLLMFFSGMLAVSLSMITLLYIPSANATWVIYLQNVPSALGGQMVTLFTAAYSYLGDLCFKANKSPTAKMGYNSACNSASLIVGSMLGPFLFRTVGYLGCYTVCVVLEVLTILFLIFFVKDVLKKKDKASLFDLSLPINAFKCMIKKREGKRRKNVIILVLIPCLCWNFNFAAEGTLLYLYMRFKFQWTEVEFGIYMTMKSISSLVGTLIIVRLLKVRMKLEDKTIAILGTLTHLLSVSVLLLSTHGWMIYLDPIVGILNRGSIFMQKPLLNRNIIAHEQGQLLSLSSIFDKVTTFLIVPAVSYFYSYTISFSPSLFLFFSVLGVVNLLISYSSIKTYPLIENPDQEKENPLEEDDNPIKEDI